MPVLDASLNPAYLMGFLVFLAVIAMAIIRQMETRKITNRFNKEDVRMVAFATTFYGVESLNRKPQRIQGAMILSSDTLVFQSRFGDKGYDLPLSAIVGIGTTDKFCNKSLYQTVVSINFKNESGAPDRVAYKIPHPVRWVTALRKILTA